MVLLHTVCLTLFTALGATSPSTVHADTTMGGTVTRDTTVSTHPVVLPARLASITTDTGAFAAGDRDFSRYPTVTFCLLAAQRRQTLLRSSVAAHTLLDTLHDLRRDTVGTASVAAVARACGAHFTITNTAPQDLPSLAQYALDEGNDSLARAVVMRLLTPTSAEEIGSWGEQLFLNAIPARTALADTVVARIDAMGPRALQARIQAHATFLDFWTAARNYDRAQEEAERIVILERDLAGAALTQEGSHLLVAYRTLMAQAFWEQTDSMTTIAHRAQQDFRRFTEASNQGRFFQKLSHDPVDSMVTFLAPDLYHTMVSGRQLPPLQADYWFPATGSDTVQPVQGKITLEVGADGYCTIQFRNGDDSYCFAPVAAAVRRWLSKYRTAGLTVTIVMATPDWTFMDGAVLPAQAAARARWYFQDYLRLPVTVAVQTTQYDYLPLPDGRRVPGAKTQFQRYLGNGPQNATGFLMLFGRDGRLLYQPRSTWDFHWQDEERTMDEYLAALLGPHTMARAGAGAPASSHMTTSSLSSTPGVR